MDDKIIKDEAMTSKRRARVKIYKRIILIINFSVLVVAIFSCIFLIVKVNSLNKRIGTLESTVKEKDEEKEIEKEKVKEMEKELESVKEKEKESTSEQKTTEEEPNIPVIEADPNGIKEPEPIKQEYKDVDSEKVVYLTFDDGPSIMTSQILDILDTYNVKATFFVNAKGNSSMIESYKDIVNRGNSLGMHSYNHVFTEVYESEESFIADTKNIHDFLYKVTGVDVKLYRFPGGSSTTKTTNMKTYIAYLNSCGYTYYDWNVSSKDASPTKATVDEIVQSVMSGVVGFNRAMVLFHDSPLKDTTVLALPTIIEKLLEQGYEILPIVNTTPPIQHRIN